MLPDTKMNGVSGRRVRGHHLRRLAVERRQVVVGEDQVEPGRLQRGGESGAGVDPHDLRLDPVGGQRRVDQVGIVRVVLEMEDLQHVRHEGRPPGGCSFTTAQKPPNSLTASTNS